MILILLLGLLDCVVVGSVAVRIFGFLGFVHRPVF
jgi:hypothetical protein